MSKIKHNSITNLQSVGLLILRVTIGLAMLIGHGLGKWDKLFGDEAIQFADPFGMGVIPSLALAVFAEVICSLLITIGLLTRWAAIPLLITMLVAIFSIHLSDGFGIMEKAILYGAGYLTLIFTGPGAISLEHFIQKKR